MFWADTRVCPYGLHASVNLCYFAHKLFFFAPLSNARSSPPARLQLRGSNVRPMAARIVYRSICVTSPTNCPIELRPNSAALGIMQVNLPSALACTFLPSPKFGCARHNASKLAFCSRLHEFSPRCGSWGDFYFAQRLPHSPRWVLPS